MEGKIQRIVAAIKTLDPGNKANFTQDNKPTVDALTEALGHDVTAAERDESWTIVQATAQHAKPADAKKADTAPAVTGQDALKFLRSKGHRI